MNNEKFPCIACKGEFEGNIAKYFCNCCNKAKEESYAISARNKVNNYFDVIFARDQYLAKHVKEAH